MELIRDFWAILVGIFAGIVWLVRLEAAMLANRKDIKRIEDQRKEDLLSANKHRDKVDDKLTGIETDIKQILLLLSSKADR